MGPATNTGRQYEIDQWLIIAYSVAISILLGIKKTRTPWIILTGAIAVMSASVLLSVPVAKIRKDKRRDRIYERYI